MKAAYIEKLGPADGILFGELRQPPAGESQVLVRMAAVAVNPVDTYIRSGAYRTRMEFPFVIGRDMTGRVEAIGSRVRGFAPGDRVWCNNQGYDGRQGTFAEHVAIDEELLYRLPDEADEKEAVAVLHSATTACIGLRRAGGLRPGQKVFINGGAGNVGSALLQMATDMGARTMVTAGSEEDLAHCRSLGAERAANYHSEDVEKEISEFAPEGVDVHWDATTRQDFEKAVAHLAFRGRIVVMAGMAARPVFPVGAFYTKDCSMHGFAVTNATREELRESAERINELMRRGKLKARISRVMPLADAAAAHHLLEESLGGKVKLSGKIVLVA